MIKELVTYIKNNSALVIDTDLFAGHLTQGAQDTCVVIYEPGGRADFYDKKMQMKNYEVYSRSKDYHTARANANVVHDVFQVMVAVTLPVVISGELWLVNTSNNRNSIQYIGEDEERRHEFTANYIFHVEQKF